MDGLRGLGVGRLRDVPLLKHRILRWFPNSGLVRARTVGAKNIASSSGCAIRRHIRLLYRRGKVRANGDVDVEDRVQKTKITGRTRARAYKLGDDMVMGWVGGVAIAVVCCLFCTGQANQPVDQLKCMPSKIRAQR